MPKRPTRTARPAADELTPKEQLFVSAFSVYWNATRAAKAAGYSVKTARQMGSELLSKPVIKTAIDRLLEKRKARYETTAENLKKQLSLIAFADVGDMHDPETGGLLAISDMPPEVRAQIAGFEHGYTSGTRGRKGNKRTREAVIKVKTRDAIAAAELLARILGLTKGDSNTPPLTGPAFIFPPGTRVKVE